MYVRTVSAGFPPGRCGCSAQGGGKGDRLTTIIVSVKGWARGLVVAFVFAPSPCL